MYSVEETQQVAVLNALMTHRSLDYDELYQYMFEHYTPPEGLDIRDNVKRLCISLKRYFNRFGVNLFKQTVMGHRYTLTDKAQEFIVENLHEPIYDEHGEIVGMYYQHPISLTEERMMLI